MSAIITVMVNRVKSRPVLNAPTPDASSPAPAAAVVGLMDASNLPAEPELLSREGFDAFARHARPRLLRYYLGRRLLLEDAQDLAQEALLRHWARREASLPPHLAFLHGIARRLYFAFLRTRQPDALSLDDLPEIGSPEPGGPVGAAVEAGPSGASLPVVKLIVRASGLTPTQRRVLQLRYREGLSVRQAAKALGVTPSTLQRHEGRGLAQLRRANGKNCQT